eukprot:6190161-Pleurochrysis_carterae.AAC.2
MWPCAHLREPEPLRALARRILVHSAVARRVNLAHRLRPRRAPQWTRRRPDSPPHVSNLKLRDEV